MDFVSKKPVAHVLGTHIEQTVTSYLDYPRGTLYQPAEHDLALSRAHVLELNQAFIHMNGRLRKVADSDFTVLPRARNPVAAPTLLQRTEAALEEQAERLDVAR